MNTPLIATVISLQIGKARTVLACDSPNGRGSDWTTGFFKDPTTTSLWLGRVNLEGDAQADLENHGGPEKAVNVYPSEHYAYWKHTVGLTDLQAGGFGENFTTEGLVETDVCIGDIFEIGEAQVQISQPRQPCWKLARRWGVQDLAIRVQATGFTGWYFRVLREGFVKAGNQLILLERHYPNWTVSTANEVMHQRQDDRQVAYEFANCADLSPRWRTKLMRRATTGDQENTTARLDGPIAGQ